MISTPPRMVIQQSMERISSFYHASATAPRTNHSDFFNSHRRYHSLRIARPRTHPFPPTLGPLAPTRTSARAGPGLTQGQILLLGNEGSFEHLYLLSLQSFEGVLRI